MFLRMLALPAIRYTSGQAIGVMAIVATIAVMFFIDTEIVMITATALWPMSGFLPMPGPVLAVLARSPQYRLCGPVR
jgi:hypothetical protein